MYLGMTTLHVSVHQTGTRVSGEAEKGSAVDK